MTEHTVFDEITWSRYLPEVLPHVKGCPQEVVENEIRKVVIDFCERSTIWRHAMDPITIEPTISEYELCDIPETSRLHTPVYVEDEGDPLRSVTPDEMDILWPRFGGKWPIDRLDTIPATPWRDFEDDIAHFYYQKDRPDLLRLIGIPTKQKVDGLTITAALKPLPDATGAPDFIYFDWFQVIAAGALGKLMAMPDEKWTNDSKAVYQLVKYDQGVDDAEGRITRAYTKHQARPLRTRTFFR